MSFPTEPLQFDPARNQGRPWHAMDAQDCARLLGVDAQQGLAETEARRRLDRHGPNKLAEKPPRSKWLLFADQFRNLLVGVLIGAALLAGAVGDLKDAVVILVVVLLNATLGFWQEFRAEATLAALKKMLAQSARVRREGHLAEVAAENLVPGDIVLLEAGDRIPADGRILVAHNAEVSESALTGESHAVVKTAGALDQDDLPLAERANLAYMNTVVTRGRLELLVTATGMRTEMGRLTQMLESAPEGQTPLQIQLDGLGRRLALIAGAVIAIIFVAGLMRSQPLLEILLTSIALAVAAIPEGLPAVVTVTLAIGMHRMARQRAIMKKLAAVETLGCTTVICSDKTGTLTLNQMTARALWVGGSRLAVSGEGYDGRGHIGSGEQDLAPVLLPAVLCNDARIADGRLVGDPTEGALLALAAKAGLAKDLEDASSPRLAEIPFDSANKFMATFHLRGDKVLMCVKGAPDVLLSRSTQLWHLGEAVPLTDGRRAEVIAANESLAGEAMRVLALAWREIPAAEFRADGDLLVHAQNLTLGALAGIIDPPRPEARDAIALCRQAGIAVKMITGDHSLTAAAIARELGLVGEVVSGAELNELDDDRLAARIEDVAVFARVSPEHKVRIVKALRERGHVVAMTGDGVNDAPALKNADIGVAMGITGTEVTKEAATMVLTDDNFATIVGAVREGRTIYDNIVKFVRFQLSTNLGALMTVFTAPFLGFPTPFTPIQILWINIIMDGPPAMTLGVDPARPGIMNDPPRQREAKILTAGRLGRLLFYGAIMAVGTLWAFHHGMQEASLPYALTLAFTTFVLFQFFNVFNARAETGTVFNPAFLKNGKLWLALAGVLLLQVVAVHWGPAQTIFNTTDLTLNDWGLAIAIASTILWLEELRKLVLRKPA